MFSFILKKFFSVNVAFGECVYTAFLLFPPVVEPILDQGYYRYRCSRAAYTDVIYTTLNSSFI